MRCAVARVPVCAKSILKSVCDVRACGLFSGVQCASALLHTFWNKTNREGLIAVSRRAPALKEAWPNLEQNQKLLFVLIKNCSLSSYSILEHPVLL